MENTNKFYSQYQQDKWLFDKYFSNKKDGVFIEIGADDGVQYSNTLFYENLGWTGLCIEPSPARYLELTSNRKCLTENVALSDYKGTTEFTDISGYGRGLSGLTEDYDQQHKNRISQEIQNPACGGSYLVDVNVDLLTNVLEKHKLYDIDFCSWILKVLNIKYYVNLILINSIYEYSSLKIINMAISKV